MRILRNNDGYTLLEALLVMGIMSFVGLGALAMMVGSATWYDATRAEAFTDTDAVIAMQMIVNDVREAKDIKLIGGDTRLRVIFPKRTPGGYYDRQDADTAHQIDFYLSDQTGVPGHSGTWLWRGKNANDRTPLKRNVVGIAFEQDDEVSPRSVKITIVTESDSAKGPKQTRLTQREVYMRNH